jgi:hypothetical protein
MKRIEDDDERRLAEHQRNYDQLVDELESKPREDLYGDLLSREQQVLETVNRIVDHERRKKMAERSWLEMPLADLAQAAVLRAASLMRDLLDAQTVEDAIAVVQKDTLAVACAGIVLVALALVLFLACSAYD